MTSSTTNSLKRFSGFSRFSPRVPGTGIAPRNLCAEMVRRVSTSVVKILQLPESSTTSRVVESIIILNSCEMGTFMYIYIYTYIQWIPSPIHFLESSQLEFWQFCFKLKKSKACHGIHFFRWSDSIRMFQPARLCIHHLSYGLLFDFLATRPTQFDTHCYWGMAAWTRNPNLPR